MIEATRRIFPIVGAITFVLPLLRPADLKSQTRSPWKTLVYAPTISTQTRGRATEGGVPFGPSRLPIALFGELFTSTKVAPSPDSILSILSAARASRLRVFIDLVGGQRHYRNSDGTFNLSMWKARLDRFGDVDFSGFIDDGTVIAHQLISEAKARSQWSSTIIPNDALDEMARYSKEKWPTMATVLRTDPSDLEEHAAGYKTPWPSWKWRYLDAAWARYLARKGPVAKFAVDEQASADRQNLAVVVGLNVFVGGDGSSGISSPVQGNSAMSPDEIRTYGSTMLQRTKACAFGMWRYETPGSAYEDFEYFRRPDINAAMRDLAALAAAAPTQSCRTAR